MTDSVSLAEPRRPTPIPYTSSVPGSLPSHFAFHHRNHRINIPKRCNPFLGESTSQFSSCARIPDPYPRCYICSKSASHFHLTLLDPSTSPRASLNTKLNQSHIGRDSLVEKIHHVWLESTQRRISLSGIGGSGKTELSISLVGKLDRERYVLWLRASDHRVLEEDLITAAEDLRHELLRFDITNNPTTGEDRSAAAFYFSSVPVKDLLSILKRWLNAMPADELRTLVILDDLDGLEPSDHEEYSRMFAGDSLDLIYTTRDPSMADLGMLWEAVDFDVPSLQLDKAVQVLEHYLRDSASTQHTSEPEHENVRRLDMENVARCLGELPAAIAMSSHYMKDSLGFRWNSDSFTGFLNKWNQSDGKGSILQAHRAMLKYRHSIFASYQVSLQRLRRNIKTISWEYCLLLLQLLSAMDLHELSLSDILKLKSALPVAWPDLQGAVRLGPDSSDEVTEMGAPGFENSIDQCLTELVKVSLLTMRSSDGTLLLNNVTKACALLVPISISSNKRAAIGNSARRVLSDWSREDVKTEIDQTDAPLDESCQDESRSVDSLPTLRNPDPLADSLSKEEALLSTLLK